jgi:glucosylceramidase
MTSSPDADTSVLRWYISSTIDGFYEPVGVPNQARLKCTDDMAGQYVVFEVTPVCSVTGLVGDSVRSEPVLIKSSSASSDNTPEISSSVSPVIVESSLEHPFTDITGHWAESRIGALFNAGIVSGRTTSKFDPEANITRAEFTAMITRAFSLVSLPYSGQFSDVSDTDWFSGSVESALRRSLISGIGDSLFAPNELITREQMASIVYRAYIAAGGEEPFGFDLMYYDSFMISPWAKESVRNVSSLGLFSGTDMNLFEPQRPATRAEAASVIYRLLRKFN